MPPKSREGAPKKLTRKQQEELALEEAQAAAAAEAAARAAQQAQLAHELAVVEEKKLRATQKVDVPQYAETESRSVLMRSFAHFYEAKKNDDQAAAVAEAAALQSQSQTTQIASTSSLDQPLQLGNTSATNRSRPSSGSKSKASADALLRKRSSIPQATASSSSLSSSSSNQNSSRTLPTVSTTTTTPKKLAVHTTGTAATSPRKSPRGNQVTSVKSPLHKKMSIGGTLNRKTSSKASLNGAASTAESGSTVDIHPANTSYSASTSSQLAALRSSLSLTQSSLSSIETQLLTSHTAAHENEQTRRDKNAGVPKLIVGIDVPLEERMYASVKKQEEEEMKTNFNSTSTSTITAAPSLIHLPSILDRTLNLASARNAPVKYEDPPDSTRRRKQVSRWEEEHGSDGSEGEEEKTASYQDTHKSSTHKLATTAIIKSRPPPKTLNAREKEANRVILARMKAFQEYKKNPRFDDGKGGKKQKGNGKSTLKSATISNTNNTTLAISPSSFLTTLTTTISHDASSLASCLVAAPSIVLFNEEWLVGQSYVREVEVKNVGKLGKRVRVENGGDGGSVQIEDGTTSSLPSSSAFTTSLPVYSNATSSTSSSTSALLAPGMSCRLLITFRPSSLRDDMSTLQVSTETGRIIIGLVAERPKARVDLDEVIDVGTCPARLGEHISCTNTITNIGHASGKWWMFTPSEYNQFVKSQEVIDVAKEMELEKWTKKISKREVDQMKFDVEELEALQTLDEAKIAPTALLAYLQSQSSSDFSSLTLSSQVTITPAIFSLLQHESIDLSLTFTPSLTAIEKGETEHFSQEFWTVSDTCVIEKYRVCANTCKVDVELTHMDGKELISNTSSSVTQVNQQSAASMTSLVFSEALLGETSHKSVTLRNRTPLPLRYQWKMIRVEPTFDDSAKGSLESGAVDRDDDSDDAVVCPFTISPSTTGLFSALASQTFEFTFTPQRIGYQDQWRAKCCVVGSEADAAAAEVEAELSSLTLQLHASSTALPLLLTPDIIIFEQDVLVGEIVRYTLVLQNRNSTEVEYDVVIGNQQLRSSVTLTPTRGRLASGMSVDVQLECVPQEVGSHSIDVSLSTSVGHIPRAATLTFRACN